VLQQQFDCDRRLYALERERCLEARGAAARGAAPAPLFTRKRKDAFDGARPLGSPTVEVGMLDIPGGALGLSPPIGVRVRVPTGKPPKAIEPIPASTLHGDDGALRPRAP
jgi:hypothetical protein